MVGCPLLSWKKNLKMCPELVDHYRRRQQPLRLINQQLQMRFTDKALSINLIQRLCTTGPRRKPTIFSADLNPTNSRAITRRIEQHRGNRLTCQISSDNMRCAQTLKRGFLLRRSSSINAAIKRCAVLRSELGVIL